MSRPLKYDRTKLLDTATDLFLKKGYRGVSIGDLVKETGVLTGSLYSSFGNKDGVFIECLHQYADRVSVFYTSAEEMPTFVGQIENLLDNMVVDSIEDPERCGCFIVNALVEIAPEKPEIQKVLHDYLRNAEAWVAERIDQAVANGELKKGVNSAELAGHIFGIAFAVRVKARSGETEERIRSFATTMFTALINPWRV